MTLAPASSGASVVVCSTCRLSADRREDDGGQRGGARLAQALREAQGASERYADIAPSVPGGWATLDACEIGNTESWDLLDGGGRALIVMLLSIPLPNMI